MTVSVNDFEMPYENNEYTKYNPLHKELGIVLTTNIKYEKKLTYNKYEIIDKNGEKKGEIDSSEFKAALFGIWLSDNPASKDLKSKMLGK